MYTYIILSYFIIGNIIMQSTRHQDSVYLLKAISYWYVHHFEEENENEMISSFFFSIHS